MEFALSRIAQTELKPPLYFPEGSRICGIEIRYDGKEWQILYHSVTSVTLTDVHDFYKRRYEAEATKWVSIHKPQGKPARFHFLVWRDRRLRHPLFSVLVLQYNEFEEDARKLNLTREEASMTQLVAGVMVPDLCLAARKEKSVSWMLPVPGSR